jgi:hypothetical protein
VIEYLPCNPETLSSNPSTVKKKKFKLAFDFNIEDEYICERRLVRADCSLCGMSVSSLLLLLCFFFNFLLYWVLNSGP